MGLKSPVLQFVKTLFFIFFLHFAFCILDTKNCKVIENSSNTPLNCSPFNCTYLDNIHYNIISAKSGRMKLKSGHLELRFSVFILMYYNTSQLP